MALLACSMVIAGCYERNLSGPEIKELIAGHHVTGRHDVRHYKFHRFYSVDGTFTQKSSTPQHDDKWGIWRVMGDKMCIDWANAHDMLCRNVVTNDRGQYWKELQKAKRDKRIITYDAITDESGRSQLKRPGFLTRFWRFWGSLGGIMLLVGTAGAFFYASMLVARAAKKPDSVGGWIRRTFLKLKAGGLAYRHGDLVGLAPGLLDRFADECMDEGKLANLRWSFDAMEQQSGHLTEAFWRLWRITQRHPDEALIEAFEVVLGRYRSDGAILHAVEADVRACYVVGMAFKKRTRGATNASDFAAAKASSLLFLGRVRTQLGIKDPHEKDAAAAEGDAAAAVVAAAVVAAPSLPGADDYTDKVAKEYEAMLYANYKPPRKNRSSSYVSGG